MLSTIIGVIAVLIIVKSIFFLLCPSAALKLIKKFAKSPSDLRRLSVRYLILGIILLIISVLI